VCDWDADGDDLTTQQESAVGTNPLDSDSDNDGISDGDKVNGGRNPLVNRRMGHSPNPDHPVGRLASG
jgi:hypothetical protein